MDNLRQRLIQAFAVVFPALSEAEIIRANSSSVSAWDSVAAINLVVVIEEEFNVQIPPEELEFLVSFDLVLDYLTKTLHAS